jgi:hypothetical protein
MTAMPIITDLLAYRLDVLLAAAHCCAGLSCLGSNASGRITWKYFFQPFGMPFLRQSDTEAGLISQISATTLVPPNLSMISESVIVGCIVGMPKFESQGMPNVQNVRIA